jgi:hypothetical protein
MFSYFLVFNYFLRLGETQRDLEKLREMLIINIINFAKVLGFGKV